VTNKYVVFTDEVFAELVKHMGDDTDIAEAAWVSNYGGDIPTDRADRIPGLINFLMRDRHGTPFEQTSLKFRVSAPLFVFYEFHRHRVGFSYNEESGRYKVLEPTFYYPGPGRNLRQEGSPGKYKFTKGSYQQEVIAEAAHKRAAINGWSEYEHLLDNGIAPEVARNVLPVSIYKTMIVTCNVRSLFNFLSLRWAHPLSTVPTFPLREIEMLSEQMEELARPLFPLAFEAFDRNGRVGP
jgi:thymidylate synthase (FAD)